MCDLKVIGDPSIFKRELQGIHVSGCRSNERLKIKLMDVSFAYYESLKRDLQTKPIYEFRCDEAKLFIMNRCLL